MMSLVRCLIAAGPDVSQLPSALPTNTQQSLRGVMPILIAITGVVLGLVLWAVFVRKSPKYRKKGVLVDGPVQTNAEGRRRRRRRHKDHRSRNPTRAETGGLPPVGSGGVNNPPL